MIHIICKEKYYFSNKKSILQKGSAFIEPINAKLQSLIEAGLIDSWVSKIRPLSNSSNCDTKAKILSTHKRALVQLTLAEVERFFMIIIVGLITSVCGLLAEMVKAKMDRNRDRNYLNKISKIRERRLRLAMLKIAVLKMMKEVKTNSTRIQKIGED